MEKFNLDFGKLKVDQLGFVFKDTEKQAKIMEDIYGFSKFKFSPVIEFPTEYRGKKTKLKARKAASQLGNTEIELVDWKEGDNPYKDFLDQGREGLHHIAVWVSDLDLYINEFKNKDIGVLFRSGIPQFKFAYMDTEKTFGIIVELMER